jgi:hypothetical protein
MTHLLSWFEKGVSLARMAPLLPVFKDRVKSHHKDSMVREARQGIFRDRMQIFT